MQGLAELESAVAAMTADDAPFALEQVEVRGQRYRSYRNQPRNLAAYFNMMANHAAKEFVVMGDERYSYGEALALSGQFAVALRERYQLAPGDRVAIAMRNNPQWMFAFIGTLLAGGIVVPMNSWWTGEELEYGLGDCGAKIVVVDPDRAARIQPFADELALIGVGDFGDGAPPDFMALVQQFEGREPEASEADPDDDACIMYTSGSTGHPKGAVQTHRSVLAALFSWLLLGGASNRVTPPAESKFSPCALMTVPLFHATGSHSLFMLSLMIGRKIVLMHKWDVQEAMRLIEAERVTNFNGVPTMSAELQAAAADSPYDLSSLKEIYAGGAARPPDQVKKITTAFKGSSAGIGYGLTETNALGSVNSGAFYLARPGSAGRPVPAVTDFRIVDEQGEPLPPGERGEVCISSPANVRGYWNKPEATAAAFRDGWFHTGDVGYIDEDGFIYIVDRIKDIIIRGGENISCIEVEAAIYQHEAVDEAAVFGLPDERLGEVVGAAVVLREPGCLDAATLQAYLADHLAGFKIPAHVWFHDDKLPRIASGKIFKRQLKADYAAQLNSGRD
ncbi:MAG: class I adenylate-forming enzyme family protein [Halieaceae bacterium]|jgi:acyl-CoA synthetase (AMP-forming)/AMP-acid ligase II|nr:class I adenylate-forming enzyme family protein [Halieaceae bacterium]